MKQNNKDLKKGIVLLLGFSMILGLMFSPIFNGQNMLDQMDNLYNSISKGSVYYIPKLKMEAVRFEGTRIQMTLKFENRDRAEQIHQMLVVNSMRAAVSDKSIELSGDLGELIGSTLMDADAMFLNKGGIVKSKYGYNEKKALYNWWLVLKIIKKQLDKQGEFELAKFVYTVNSKAVECAFNYYRIEPQNVSERAGFVTASLGFYVIYTIWFGFAVMFCFSGMGLKIE